MADKTIDELNVDIKNIDNQLDDVRQIIHKNQNLQEENSDDFRKTKLIMNEIQGDFYQDEKLGRWLGDMDMELEQRYKKIEQTLADKEDELQNQKRKLNNDSEDLIAQRRKLY